MKSYEGSREVQCRQSFKEERNLIYRSKLTARKLMGKKNRGRNGKKANVCGAGAEW